MMVDGFVESPILRKNFPIGTAERVDAYCPIDATQLISVTIYDDEYYKCVACGARYQYGNLDTNHLKKQAGDYIRGIKEILDKKLEQITRLEEILEAARKSGLF